MLLLVLQAAPGDPASPVHPRRFGAPGGVGLTRGWYLWGSFDAEAGTAVVFNEQSGEKITTRVLPWLTSYRHLVYPGFADELLPGERLNLFFNPEGNDKRAYLVHVQDEIGQMKGHGHAWHLERVAADGRSFSARAQQGDKPLGDPADFELDAACRNARGLRDPLAAGLRLYLTWCLEGKRRVVKLLVDDAGLETLKAEALTRVAARVAREGFGAFVEEGRLLIFASTWSQARTIKPGQTLAVRGAKSVEVKVLSSRNLGAYGSGATDLVVEGEPLKDWPSEKLVRVFPR